MGIGLRLTVLSFVELFSTSQMILKCQYLRAIPVETYFGPDDMLMIVINTLGSHIIKIDLYCVYDLVYGSVRVQSLYSDIERK